MIKRKSAVMSCLLLGLVAILACSEKSDDTGEEVNMAQLKQASITYYAMPG